MSNKTLSASTALLLSASGKLETANERTLTSNNGNKDEISLDFDVPVEISCNDNSKVRSLDRSKSYPDTRFDESKLARGNRSSCTCADLGFESSCCCSKHHSLLRPLDSIFRVRFASLIFGSVGKNNKSVAQNPTKAVVEKHHDDDEAFWTSSSKNSCSWPNTAKRIRRNRHGRHKVTFSFFCISMVFLAIHTPRIVLEFLEIFHLVEHIFSRDIFNQMLKWCEIMYLMHFNLCCVFYVYCNRHLYKAFRRFRSYI